MVQDISTEFTGFFADGSFENDAFHVKFGWLPPHHGLEAQFLLRDMREHGLSANKERAVAAGEQCGVRLEHR
jgi:hypothetical protein